MREFLYLFTWGFDINNDFVSFFASTDFMNKPTNSGVYSKCSSQQITFLVMHVFRLSVNKCKSECKDWLSPRLLGLQDLKGLFKNFRDFSVFEVSIFCFFDSQFGDNNVTVYFKACQFKGFARTVHWAAVNCNYPI